MDRNRILFWNLVEPEHAAAQAFCRRLAGNRDDGDDLYQDSLVKALTAFERLRDSRSFRPWFYRIIVNQFKNRVRTPWYRRLRPLSEAVELEATAFDPGPARAARRRLEIGLQALKPTDRALIVLYELEGWTVRELAAMTGKTENGIKVRLSRARKRVRERLVRLIADVSPPRVEGSVSECVVPKPGKE